MKKIILLIILTLLISSCWQEKIVEIKKNFKTSVVWTGIVNTDDNFIGYTKGIKQALLAPKVPWRITYMWKNIWDKIYAWNLLASLDWAEAKNGYNTANNIIANLENIKNKTNKAFDDQIIALEKKIDSVKAQINWVTTWLEDTKDITKSQLTVAKANLEETKKN